MLHSIIQKIMRPIKSSFWHFLISYSSVLLIPVLLVYLVYFFSSQIIKKEVNQTASSMLEQARSVIDSRLKEIDDLAIQLSWNPRIHHFMNAARPLSEFDKYEAFNISKELRNYTVSNRFVKDFYIYFRNNDYIINSQSRYDQAFFYDYICSYPDKGHDQWYRELLGKYHYKEYLGSKPVLYDSGKQNTITYLQSLPFDDRHLWQGTLVVMIDNEAINDILKNIGSVENCFTYITDKNNQIIAYAGKEDIVKPVKYQDLAENRRFTTKMVNGSNMAIAHISSRARDWKLVSITPMDVHLAEAVRLKNLTLKLSMILFLVGIITAYLLVYRNYISARDILNTINQRLYLSPSQTGRRVKFHSIKSVVEKALDESHSFRKQIPTLKAGFLAKLVKGNIRNADEINSYLKLLDLYFKHPVFCVFILNLSSSSGSGSLDEKFTAQSIERLASDIVFKISFNDLSVYAFPLEDDKIAVLCNMSGYNDEDNCIIVNQIAEQLSKQLSEDNGMNVTIAISDFCHDMEGIHGCYQQAMLALKYRLIKGKNTIIRYRDILPSEDKEDYYYPLKTENCLINMIKAGDTNEVNRLLEEVFRKNFLERQLSPAIVRCLMFDMMSTALKCIQETNIAWEKTFKEKYDPSSQLSKCETIEELFITIRFIYSRLCEHMNMNKKSHNTLLKEKLQVYINENYKNKDLCLNSIAREFDLAPAYISHFFKEQTGENLIDYLNKIRLEKAVVLLEGKDELLISKVADEVGYSNTSTMIRTFKKYKGITPTQYKEQYNSN